MTTCFSLRLLALYSLKCQEEEEERLGEQISCGKTALETLRLLTSSKERTSLLIFFPGCSPAPKKWPPSSSLIKLSSGRTPAIPSFLSRERSAGACVHQMISEIDPRDLTRFYVCIIQRSARILDPRNSRRESVSFFLAQPREMIFKSLDLVSKHENNNM